MHFQNALVERTSPLVSTGGAASQRGLPDALKMVQTARYDQAANPGASGLAPWQIKRVSAHVEACLSEKLCLDDLAVLAKLSTSYFSTAFRRSFGTSPYAYIVERRMERAKQLMVDGRMPLCEIALECGLADQAHLSRVFRRVTGMTPTGWKQRQACAAVSYANA